ncbi:MAG TPA: cation transporter [Stellaceae bacterium]|nr:cation transporter [Stellaceae bacterium]
MAHRLEIEIDQSSGHARAALVREAFTLEMLTAGWLLIETAVAIGAGMSAHSLTLTAFGVDSVIELLSACVLLWRLNVELRLGREFSERAERRAAKYGGALLVALIVYVVASAFWDLWRGAGQDVSIPGLVLATLAMPIMYGFARAKTRIAIAIGSAALRADAAESIACAYLSAVVVIGLLAQWLTGAWWIDGISALALTPFLLKEAREAWEAE